MEEYKSQWKDAVRRILLGHQKSCLVTSMLNPVEAVYIIIWPLYRRKDIIYIHNNIFFLDSLTEPFDLTNLYNSVPERETVSEGGEPISEWCVPINDLSLWLKLS